MNLIKRIAGQPEPSAPAAPEPAPRPTLDYDDLQRTFVLLSNFRSGTHFFKTMLNRVARVHAPAEPFNLSLAGGNDLTFRRFIDGDTAPQTSTILKEASVIFDYLAHFYANTPPEQKILFDLKYSQAYALGVNEQRMVPTILEEFVKVDLPFVHLIRRDLIAQAVSLLVAEITGEFHKTGDSKDDQRFWLDPDQVLEVTRSRRFAIDEATRHLDVLGARVVTVFYEDLISPEWKSELRRTFRFLDHYADIPDDFDPVTANQKSASRVANIGEIVQHISARDPSLVSRQFY